MCNCIADKEYLYGTCVYLGSEFPVVRLATENV